MPTSPVTQAVYTNFGGQIVHEIRGETELDYMPDTLGSTIALLDSSSDKTDTWEYWPYGEVESRTGNNVTPFSFVGSLGYFRDLVSKLTYVRARFYQAFTGQWMSKDSLWPEAHAYLYVNSSPVSQIDPFGLMPLDMLFKGCVALLCASVEAIQMALDLFGLKAIAKAGYKELADELLDWSEKDILGKTISELLGCSTEDCIKSATSKKPYGLGALIAWICSGGKIDKDRSFCYRLHCGSGDYTGNLKACEDCCQSITIGSTKDQCMWLCGIRC